MSANGVAVFVVAHKDFKWSTREGYKPIAVGSFSNSCPNSFVRDNDGDNISEKNPYYCELTAQYWVFKNYPPQNIVGFCHYRRFFAKSRVLTKCILTPKDIEKRLSEADIILPEQWSWGTETVREKYSACEGRDKDLLLTRQVIQEVTPAYSSTFDNVLNSNSASYCNMFIMRDELFRKYAEWLFSILFEVENNIDLSGYTPAEARVFGYLAEVLLNVWVQKNGLIIHEERIVNTDVSFAAKIASASKKRIRH